VRGYGYKGTYEVDGNQVTFFLPSKCDEEGIYKWMFDGEVLFLETFEETCPERHSIFVIKKGLKKQ
jgi:hypothetical protein